jgi:hypothetical protein
MSENPSIIDHLADKEYLENLKKQGLVICSFCRREVKRIRIGAYLYGKPMCMECVKIEGEI